MPLIEVEADLTYEVTAPSGFLFQIALAQSARQQIESETLTIGGNSDVPELLIPPVGIRAHRVSVDPGRLSVEYRATVRTEPLAMTEPVRPGVFAEIPANVLPFTYPSRYCESSLLVNVASDRFGDTGPEFLVGAVSDWASQMLSYTPGSTNANTTAADVFLSRRGVCRDYAHLTVTLCRALGIPARYTAGYVVDLQPPDFHAVVEAYLDGRWWLFDATRLAPLQGFVRIGSGRDAADVSFATIDGEATLSEMRVQATFADGTQPDASDLTPLSLCD